MDGYRRARDWSKRRWKGQIEAPADRMTSLAFGFGVLPLAWLPGRPGAQNANDPGVLGGMIAATFLAIPFIPLF